METRHSVFWEDLARDLENPQFLREYVLESVRVDTIDRVVNDLDAAREAAGLSKAALARAIRGEPAVLRRLFSAGHVNPTLGTVAEVAAALGMRVALEPLPDSERAQISDPLIAGHAADTHALVGHLGRMRLGRRQSEPA